MNAEDRELLTFGRAVEYLQDTYVKEEEDIRNYYKDRLYLLSWFIECLVKRMYDNEYECFEVAEILANIETSFSRDNLVSSSK